MTPTVGMTVVDNKTGRVGVITEVRDGDTFFARPVETPYLVPFRDGKLIMATAWSKRDDVTWSGLWADSPLNAWTTVRLIEAQPEGSAAALGRKGGKARSERKVAASRTNGKKGGRPRKEK